MTRPDRVSSVNIRIALASFFSSFTFVFFVIETHLCVLDVFDSLALVGFGINRALWIDVDVLSFLQILTNTNTNAKVQTQVQIKIQMSVYILWAMNK